MKVCWHWVRVIYMYPYAYTRGIKVCGLKTFCLFILKLLFTVIYLF